MDRPEIERTITQIVANKLDVDIEAVTLDSDLANDLGMNSMDAIELIFEIEDQFNIEIPEENFANIRRVRDLIELLPSQARDR